jgi:hypothetical protein
MLLAPGTEAEEAWERLQKTPAWKLRRAYSRKLCSPDPVSLQKFLRQLKIPASVNTEAGLLALKARLALPRGRHARRIKALMS